MFSRMTLNRTEHKLQHFAQTNKMPHPVSFAECHSTECRGTVRPISPVTIAVSDSPANEILNFTPCSDNEHIQ